MLTVSNTLQCVVAGPQTNEALMFRSGSNILVNSVSGELVWATVRTCVLQSCVSLMVLSSLGATLASE